jgi:hypothetical protein
MTGERPRRVWRWAVMVWLVAVVLGGGLTLWLQDSTRPPGPYSWQRAEPTATPSVPEGWETRCPSPTTDPDRYDRVLSACAFTRG